VNHENANTQPQFRHSVSVDAKSLRIPLSFLKSSMNVSISLAHN
jgi:hypothetical protein